MREGCYFTRKRPKKVEIAKDAINFITDREESELVRDAKSAIIICEEAMDKLNKQGEAHDK